MVFRSLSNIHAEHDGLGRHGGHLVAEAVLVHTIHVGCKCILAIGLSITGIDQSPIWTLNLQNKEYFKWKGLATLDMYVCMSVDIIGASLSEPHLVTTAAVMSVYIIYIAIYLTSSTRDQLLNTCMHSLFSFPDQNLRSQAYT